MIFSQVWEIKKNEVQKSNHMWRNIPKEVKIWFSWCMKRIEAWKNKNILWALSFSKCYYSHVSIVSRDHTPAFLYCQFRDGHGNHSNIFFTPIKRCFTLPKMVLRPNKLELLRMLKIPFWISRPPLIWIFPGFFGGLSRLQ